MPTLLEDIAIHPNSICISPYGSYVNDGKSESNWALGFRGTVDFIERCYNMCHNRGIIKPRASLHWYYLNGSCLGYVLVRSKEKLLAGLTQQFRGEIITHEEVKPESFAFNESTQEYDFQFDDRAIDRIATRRAEDFLEDHIPQESFMARIEESVMDSYEVAPQRSGNEEE